MNGVGINIQISIFRKNNNNLNLYHILYIKINLKWNMDINKKSITIKVLKEIIKGNLCDHVVNNFFLDRAPRDINTKKKLINDILYTYILFAY